MRIAHTVFSVNSKSGGIGPVVEGLTHAISQIDSATPKCYVPETGFADDFLTPLQTFKCWGPPQYCLSPSLKQQIAADQNDLIHCHGLWTFLARTNLDWHKSGKPFVLSPHGMTMPRAMDFSRWKKKLFWPLFEKRNLDRAGFIQSVSAAESASVRALGIKSPIIQIGNGVDLPAEAASQTTNTDRNDGCRTLLYLGRLHPIKGVDKLIGAWQSEANHAKAKNWRLQIVGWGADDYMEKIKSQISDDKSVVFSGPLFGDQKHAAFNQANAFVLPSSSEAFPMALMEAWSHGLPAVATKICSVVGEVGESSSFFVDDSQEAILAGIQELVNLSDQQRQEMGNRIRSFVAEDYSWSAIANQLVESYRWLLGGGPEPGHLLFD